MKVLVSGHHGYIGSVLVRVLTEAGHEVVGLDTFFYRGCDFGPANDWRDARARDVRDVRAPELEGFDALVHLAALSNDPLGDFDPALTHEINLGGTVSLAEAAREAGVWRFVFASSCSLYGAAGPDDVLDEDAPLRPLTPYAESKVRAEEALWDLGDDDFCVVSMRNATVYGISPRLRLDVVLNNLAAWAVTAGVVQLLSDGSSWRPLLHVHDLAVVTEAILRAPHEVVRGEVFNIGTEDQNYLVRDLADIVAEAAGAEVRFARGADSDPRSYRVDFSKLARSFPELEFRWDARRGAEQVVRSLRSQSLSRDDFEGRKYIRLRQLRHLLDVGALRDDLRWSHEAVPAS
jgi:nucleoside-diphosphate-sugar epimerase